MSLAEKLGWATQICATIVLLAAVLGLIADVKPDPLLKASVALPYVLFIATLVAI